MTIRGPFAIGLLVVLFVSVAANLLIVGFTVGRASTGPRPPTEIEQIVALGARAFPAPLRELIAERSRERRADLRAQLREVEEARRATYAAMRADPFDAETLRAAHDAFRAATDALQRTGQEIVEEVLVDVPAEERQKISAGRRPPLFDRGPREGNRDGRRGPPRETRD